MKKRLCEVDHLKYLVTYLDSMNHMRALAAFASVELAKQFAKVSIEDMKLSGASKSVTLYVYDQDGHHYGSFAY